MFLRGRVESGDWFTYILECFAAVEKAEALAAKNGWLCRVRCRCRCRVRVRVKVRVMVMVMVRMGLGHLTSMYERLLFTCDCWTF